VAVLGVERDVDRVATQFALERVRRAGRHDAPAIDDRELRGDRRRMNEHGPRLLAAFRDDSRP
jgi:hypothetical protein